MNATDIDPWFFPLDPPELSDEELNAIGEENVRLDCERLLRAKRAPAVWHELNALGIRIAGKIDDLESPEVRGGDLDNHIECAALVKRLRTLGIVIITQKDWHLRTVQISRDEVNALVTRWLLLKYGTPHRPPNQGVSV